MEEEKKQPEEQLPVSQNGKAKKIKKQKDPDHMKYPYLIYGAAFGLVIGLLIGYYYKNPLFWTLVCGLAGTVIGGLAQLFHKNK